MDNQEFDIPQSVGQELLIEELREENTFYKEFLCYLVEHAIGDKESLLSTVYGNTRNCFEGYVKVEKSIKGQDILLTFKDKKCNKHTATWQASDNYACCQACGITGDDYHGYLLFPTYKDEKYFCLFYEC